MKVVLGMCSDRMYGISEMMTVCIETSVITRLVRDM